mgnify:CR=1 FL=1
MSVWAMPSGAMVQSHESFTHPFAGSGFEVHGTEGSIFTRGVMTQKPVGEIELATAIGREIIPYPGHDHDLYTFGVTLLWRGKANPPRPAGMASNPSPWRKPSVTPPPTEPPSP